MINKVKAKSNDHIEEWGEVTNKIQSFYHWVGKNYFTNHQITQLTLQPLLA